jgi:hypothetical protein
MEVITVPSKEDTVDAVIKLALLPVVLDVSGRVLQLIELSARSMPPHETAEIIYRVGKRAEGGVIAMGEARVVLRGAGYRYIFSLEAIFARLAVGSRLSAVNLRGKIEWIGGRAVVEIVARTNRHDTWEWSREFRPEAHVRVQAQKPCWP